MTCICSCQQTGDFNSPQSITKKINNKDEDVSLKKVMNRRGFMSYVSERTPPKKKHQANPIIIIIASTDSVLIVFSTLPNQITDFILQGNVKW